jgi:hypothetical protein
LDFGRACTRARGAAARVLTVSFITCSIFGIFHFFLDLDILAGSNEENIGTVSWASPFGQGARFWVSEISSL